MSGRFDVTGRTALVTGAGSGLGQGFAKALANAGAHVVLAARRVDKLEETAAGIRAGGGEATTIALDVTSAQSVDDCFHELDERKLLADIIVNNAGISGETFLLRSSESDWDAVLDTNLKGVMLVAQAGVQRLAAASKGGSVINIASVIAFRAVKTLGAYGAAKSAVVHLTATMAVEWARYGVRVNAIAPGYFVTDMNRDALSSEMGERLCAITPLARFGEIDELDGALLLLASDAGSYITGTTIAVDGGLRHGGF